MKYNIMIGIGFLICLFIFLPTVHADDGTMYQVDVEKITFKEAPAADAAIAGELKKDYKVTIFEESNGWGKTFYKGEPVWVALHHISLAENAQTELENGQSDTESPQNETAAASETNIAPAASAENGQLYRVQAPAVNLRHAPDKNAAIVTQLQYGEKVTIFEVSYGWGKTYYQNEEVWIALYLLQQENKSAGSDDISEEKEIQDSPKKAKAANEKLEAAKEQKDAEIEAIKSTEDKSDVQAEQSSGTPLAGRHFVIDPGHGGKDPGAVGSEVYEKTLALTTAIKLGDHLRQQGASVTFTREDDVYISLDERVHTSHAAKPDAFISLHYNASENQNAHGIETFYNAGNDSQVLAQSVQTSLMHHVHLHDRGAKPADFQVLKDNKQTAVLVELGFISNSKEQQMIQTDNYQKNATDGIVAGLEAYFH